MAETPAWIAIVDDDLSVLRALSRLLRTHACHTKTYDVAHRFLAALGGGLPECLVLDWQMPEMNGVELLEQMTRQGLRVPTIMISAHIDASARERCLSAGALTFLAKPLQDTELLAAIQDARKIARNIRVGPTKA